jgi:hypothetical protein
MTITQSCGHVVDRNVRETPRGRAYKATLEGTPCWACGNAVHAEAATAQAESLGLPRLEGSPAQIRWATTIRADVMAQIGGDLDNMTHQHDPRLPDMMATAEAITYGMRRASWWIDAAGRRRRPTIDLLEQYLPYTVAIRASLEDET